MTLLSDTNLDWLQSDCTINVVENFIIRYGGRMIANNTVVC